uniref:Selenoprotein P N-terminal domain-containing protein n=1 Tax=Cyprinus carpio TaxID=7962 RepID=A0A8C2JPP6_CYPCA
MVVNNRDERSQRLHHLLKERLMNIALYAQDLSQPDLWEAVNAEKDDILVYDSCGRLTYHLSLPYTILSHPHVEEAIRNTFCGGICGECSMEKTTDENTAVEEERHHHQEHHGHHGHGHEGHHSEGVERDRQGGSHHHRHHHHGQQQVDLGQQMLAQVDFGQAAIEPPVMKQP